MQSTNIGVAKGAPGPDRRTRLRSEGLAVAGIGRAAYVAWIFGYVFAAYPVSEGEVHPYLLILGALGLLILCRLRLRSIGYRPWTLLLCLVPYINMVVILILVALPAGYASTKKADVWMRAILWGYFGLTLSLALWKFAAHGNFP